MPNNNSRKITTIKHIAAQAGVSTATVSRAINKGKGMSQPTRDRVLRIAKSLKYFPNLQARSLVARRPNVIEVIISQSVNFTFDNPFHLEGLKGIVERVRESGHYSLLSFSGEESYGTAWQHGFAAGIIVLANVMDDLRIGEAFRIGVPMVLVPGYPKSHTIHSVDVDNIDGVSKGVEYLASLGHRRIAFISGPSNSKYTIDRLAGYRKGLKISLQNEKEIVSEGGFSEEEGYQGMKKLLRISEIPTAVLAVNDFSAIGALRASKEAGYRVPDDISIIGFGNAPSNPHSCYFIYCTFCDIFPIEEYLPFAGSVLPSNKV